MTNKRSFLQNKITTRIDNLCGIENLVKFLKRFKNTLPSHQKLYALSIIQYYESLYLYYVDVESDCVNNRDTAIEWLSFLNEYKCVRDCSKLDFLVDSIGKGLEYSDKTRKLS